MWRGLLDLVFPPRCLLCERPPAGAYFCRHCVADLFEDGALACPRCAAVVGPFAACAACLGQRLGFDAAFRLGTYDGTLRRLALLLKSPHHEGIGELLGREWGARQPARFAALNLTAVVPVPLHWGRRLWRGYNQAEAVGRGLSASIGVPLRAGWLWRLRHTADQKGLGGRQRRENVRGAFCVRKGLTLAGERVLLVDDVMTTGATCGECAAVLRAAGADWVQVAVLARTSDGVDQARAGGGARL